MNFNGNITRESSEIGNTWTKSKTFPKGAESIPKNMRVYQRTWMRNMESTWIKNMDEKGDKNRERKERKGKRKEKV